MNIVLIDRDGVINRDLKHSVRSLQEFTLIPGSAQAISHLNKAKFKVVVITNQSVVGRGDISEAKLHEIHRFMQAELEKQNAYIDDIIYCIDAVDSYRRKPAPGMIFEALDKYGASPLHTPFVGDALRDLQAAEAAQCIPILVKTGKGLDTLESGLPKSLEEVKIYNDLNDFAQNWINHHCNSEIFPNRLSLKN